MRLGPESEEMRQYRQRLLEERGLGESSVAAEATNYIARDLAGYSMTGRLDLTPAPTLRTCQFCGREEYAKERRSCVGCGAPPEKERETKSANALWVSVEYLLDGGKKFHTSYGCVPENCRCHAKIVE